MEALEHICERAGAAAQRGEEASAVDDLTRSMVQFATHFIAHANADSPADEAFLALAVQFSTESASNRVAGAPVARRQEKLLKIALSRALRTSAPMRALFVRSWTRGLEAKSGDVSHVQRVMARMHVDACAEAPEAFRDAMLASITDALAKSTQTAPAAARKRACDSIVALHDEIVAATCGEPLSAVHTELLTSVARKLLAFDTSANVRCAALECLVSLGKERREGSSDVLAQDTLDALRGRSCDVNPRVRASALSALCAALDPSTAAVDDLRLVLERGCFDREMETKTASNCREFVVAGLTAPSRSPIEILQGWGIAHLLLNIDNVDSGRSGLELLEGLLDGQAACKVYDAIHAHRSPSQVLGTRPHLPQQEPSTPIRTSEPEAEVHGVSDERGRAPSQLDECIDGVLAHFADEVDDTSSSDDDGDLLAKLRLEASM